MRRAVLDASVAALWYFPESLTPQADALLAGSCELLAPDTLQLEIAALAQRRVRRGEIDVDAARAVLGELRQVPFEWTAAAALMPAALDLALDTGLAVADCLYVALAEQIPCPLVTADRRLLAAARAAGRGREIVWLGDLPAR